MEWKGTVELERAGHRWPTGLLCLAACTAGARKLGGAWRGRPGRRRHPASESQHGRGALGLGGLATILASICCLGPLVLVAIGVSGAWIGNLTVLEPYRPSFFGAALVAFFFAYWRIFRPAQACKPGEVCAVPQVKTAYKIIFGIVAALTGIALAFPSILAPLLLSQTLHQD